MCLPFSMTQNEKNEALCKASHHYIITDKISEFIQLGADVNARNKYGSFPLHLAAENNAAAIPILLAHQADPSVRDLQERLPEDVAKSNDTRARLAAAREAKALEAEASKPDEKPASRSRRV